MRSLNSIIASARNRVISEWYAQKDFRTGLHIIVFESDDWGSIRMSKRKDWDELLRLGYPVDKRPYERYDTLESPNDLIALFDVLNRHTDMNGHHPVITANMLMVNPDFERIESSGFKDYYYEPISETYARYFGDSRIIDIMFQGMREGLFMPQSHGREHFNVPQWMYGLRSEDEDLLTALRHGMCGIAPKRTPWKGNQYMNALRAGNEEEQKVLNQNLEEGLKMFEQMWGFRSKSFVAPCFCWSELSEKSLANCGVELIQTSRVNKPAYKTPIKYFFTGQKNSLGQVYSIRNCHFEPSTNPGGESINALMKQTDLAFHQRKIAVFSTHRINFVGGIHEEKRTENLKLLDDFLTKVLKKYPDILFLSSDHLVEIIKDNENSHSSSSRLF